MAPTASVLTSTSTSVKSVLRRLSVSLPHHSHSHHKSASTASATQIPQQPKPALATPPPSKRAPTTLLLNKTPAEAQLDVIESVCAYLEQRMEEDGHLVIEDVDFICFQGPKAPEISLKDYIVRLVKYANNFCEDVPRANSSGIRSLLIALEYIHRCGAVVSPRTVHRYLLISVLVAVKTMEDFVMEGSYWGAVGGCTVPELNLYERQFLKQLRFSCHVSTARFAELCEEFGCPVEEDVDVDRMDVL